MNDLTKRLTKAAHDLQSILDEIGPFIKRPMVETPVIRGRWTTTGLSDRDVPEERAAADNQKADVA